MDDLYHVPIKYDGPNTSAILEGIPMGKVSQAEIAKLAGVSRSTVAWALSTERRHKLKPETCRRVEEAAAKLNYRPNLYAQIMRNGRSEMIGMLRFPGYSEFRSELERDVIRQIRSLSYRPMMMACNAGREDVETGCREMLDAQVEGVLVEGPSWAHTSEAVTCFQDRNIPVVILSGTDQFGVPHVHADFRTGMFEITQRLISLGRQRLCMLVPWVDPETYRGDWWRNFDRIMGFCESVRAHNGSLVDVDGRLELLTEFEPRVGAFKGSGELEAEIYFAERFTASRDPYASAKVAATRILSASSRPDALLCPNDDWAIGTMSACHNLELAVPEQIAITGFDDATIGKYLPSPLTTVRQPVDELAQQAVDLLFRLIRGEEVGEGPFTLATHMVVRQSCGGSAVTSET